MIEMLKRFLVAWIFGIGETLPNLIKPAFFICVSFMRKE